MKYITILEKDTEVRNVGTITTVNLEEAFKTAVEQHFDAELISFYFNRDDVDSLDDCINANPIDVTVVLFPDEERVKLNVELSQTWLY